MYFQGKLFINDEEIQFRCGSIRDSVGAYEHERSVRIPDSDNIEVIESTISDLKDAENLVRENFHKVHLFKLD